MHVEAEPLRCSACGALVGENSVSCPYCGASLKTVACPKCFGLVPVNAKHCPLCGTLIEGGLDTHPVELLCPDCKHKMDSSHLGGADINTCSKCGGIWLDRKVFENLSADREQRGLVMTGLGSNAVSATPESSIKYRPCPVCNKFMNRINYARISGVIVDICKSHGVWFDSGELGDILNFIEKGGLLRAQEKERMKLEDARRETNSAIAAIPMGMPDNKENQIELSDVFDFLDSVIDFFKR